MILKKCKCEKSPSPWELVKVKKPKNEVIRVGDYVEILNPETFIRAGYPLTTQDILDNHITPEQRKLLNELIISAGFNTVKSYFLTGKEKDVSELEMSFARLLLRAKGWGGRERTIHTKLEPELLNKVGRVVSKKYVKTGTYVSGGAHGWSSYGEDYDYEPPYLKDERTVCIYELSIWAEYGIFNDYKSFSQDNVVKITQEDYDEIISKTPPLKFEDLWKTTDNF